MLSDHNRIKSDINRKNLRYSQICRNFKNTFFYLYVPIYFLYTTTKFVGFMQHSKVLLSKKHISKQ